MSFAAVNIFDHDVPESHSPYAGDEQNMRSIRRKYRLGFVYLAVGLIDRRSTAKVEKINIGIPIPGRGEDNLPSIGRKCRFAFISLVTGKVALVAAIGAHNPQRPAAISIRYEANLSAIR